MRASAIEFVAFSSFSYIRASTKTTKFAALFLSSRSLTRLLPCLAFVSGMGSLTYLLLYPSSIFCPG